MLLEIGLLGATLFLWLYWYTAKNFGKWEKLGFPCISGTFPWGSYKGIYRIKCWKVYYRLKIILEYQ